MIKRNKVLSFLSICLLVLLLAGCASAPLRLGEPVKKNRVFEASYDTTWNATMKAITTSGEIITVAQKESGVMSFQRDIGTQIREYAITNLLYGYPLGRANVNVILTKQNENHTRVTINGKILAGTNNLELVSTGKLEKEYLDKIAALITGNRRYDWLE